MQNRRAEEKTLWSILDIIGYLWVQCVRRGPMSSSEIRDEKSSDAMVFEEFEQHWKIPLILFLFIFFAWYPNKTFYTKALIPFNEYTGNPKHLLQNMRHEIYYIKWIYWCKPRTSWPSSHSALLQWNFLQLLYRKLSEHFQRIYLVSDYNTKSSYKEWTYL